MVLKKAETATNQAFNKKINFFEVALLYTMSFTFSSDEDHFFGSGSDSLSNLVM